MTTNVLIVYATELGNTGKMAERVVEGVRFVPGTQVVLKEAETNSSVLGSHRAEKLFDALQLFDGQSCCRKGYTIHEYD